ncbi:MAG: LysR family transcriptional regulator [Mogibacterium sp.]|nr:LysR family transcriptional regulator [Mogibacterium sp.]
MELRQLYYVLETAKYKSFTKAAEALYTSQPNVSKQISLLEDELGTQLFFRSHHNVLLTKDGELFCKYAEKVVADLDELMKAFHQNTQDDKAVLNIAVFVFFQRMKFASILRAFYRDNANVVGTLRLSDNNMAYEGLDDGSIDFAILKLRPEDRQKRFQYHLLMAEELLGMISSSSELAGKERLTAEDLRPIPVLTGEEGSSLYEDFQRLYRERNIPYNVALQNTYNIDFLIEMLSENNGITYITASAAATIKDDRITTVPLDPPVDYCTYLVYPKGRTYTGIYRKFIDYVIDEMSEQ